jgi:hypothetical protein
MKRTTIVAAVLVIVFAGTASAFDFAVGGRVAGVAGLAGLNTYTAGVGTTMIQGQVLLGPLELGIGVIPGAIGIYPISVGFLGKFPIPVVQPYIGGEFTYLLAPELNSTPDIQMHIFIPQIKGGAEFKLGQVGVYGGIGYSFMLAYINIPGYFSGFGGSPLGITWELGARYYLF